MNPAATPKRMKRFMRIDTFIADGGSLARRHDFGEP
jgi:hypothetical protein